HRAAAPAAGRAPGLAPGPRVGAAGAALRPGLPPAPAEPVPPATAADRHLPVGSAAPATAYGGGGVPLTGNGERRGGPDGLTVAALVAQLGVRGRVAVELNGEVLRQAEHPGVTLRDGDTLEVVTFVGGGA